MLQKRINEARTLRSDQGFTLIELLIVIVVLGILAGIVVFGVQNFRGDATAAACKSDVKTVTVASEAFKAAPANTTNGGPAPSIAALVTAGWLKSAPLSTSGVTYDATTGNVSSTVCP